MAFAQLFSFVIFIEIVSICTQDVFENTPILQSAASCFGLENDHTRWMRATCSSQDLVILIESFTVVFHPVVMNCTNNTVIYEEYRQSCCLKESVNSSRDCTVTHQFDTKYSVANYQTCNGHSSCNVMAPQLLVRNSNCPYDIYEPTPHDIVSNFMYMNYYCLERSLILPDSTGSLTTPSPDSVIYLQSPGFNSYNQRIPYKKDSECSVQTGSCNSEIYIYVLHRVLEDSDTSEWNDIPCNQTLKIENSSGDVLHKWTCDDNTNLQKGHLTITANYIRLKLDNNYTTSDKTGNVTINCPATEPPLCIDTTTTVMTTSTDTSSTFSTTSARENTTATTDSNPPPSNTTTDSTQPTPIVAVTSSPRAIPMVAVIALPSGLSIFVIVVVVIAARLIRSRRRNAGESKIVVPSDELNNNPYDYITNLHLSNGSSGDDQYMRPLPIANDQKDNTYDNNIPEGIGRCNSQDSGIIP
ncbi:hypothetical protein MAR_010425 [Mya arenaria]|uniref:Uncharacterized protein n=1 Tax=Mya arenaria TaxID=6604 RepID=A0ABY7E4Z0_MYAAR|nr:hypothetical protein MAR_010425 [Mya arenaria]